MSLAVSFMRVKRARRRSRQVKINLSGMDGLPKSSVCPERWVNFSSTNQQVITVLRLVYLVERARKPFAPKVTLNFFITPSFSLTVDLDLDFTFFL